MSETAAAVDIRPIQGSFGAEIIGLDLSQELPDGEFHRIEQAWFDASLLVFRDLEMTPQQHIAVTRRFGPLHIMTPLHYNHPDHPEVMVLTNREEGGKPLGIRRAGMAERPYPQAQFLRAARAAAALVTLPEAERAAATGAEVGRRLHALRVSAVKSLPRPAAPAD